MPKYKYAHNINVNRLSSVVHHSVIEAHDRVRVLPAYDMDSHARTRHDLWSGQTGEVKEVRGSDALVRLPGSDVWLNVGRLETLTRSFREAQPTTR